VLVQTGPVRHRCQGVNDSTLLLVAIYESSFVDTGLVGDGVVRSVCHDRYCW
jgi:hypothetical protein